jgi:FK506-binding protein 1
MSQPLPNNDPFFAQKGLAQLVRQTVVTGDGRSYPQIGDSLTMHYTGRLLVNGQQFDSSVARGIPFTFKIGVGQVIKVYCNIDVSLSLSLSLSLSIEK